MEKKYEVEVVLGYRGKMGYHIFLIWWKGYSTVEDNWKPEHNLGNTQPLITTYKITHPKDFPEYNHHCSSPQQKWTPTFLPLFSSFSPSQSSLAGYATFFGRFSTPTWGSPLVSLGKARPSFPWTSGVPQLTGRRCGGSLILTPVLPQLDGKGYKVLHQASPFLITMLFVMRFA